MQSVFVKNIMTLLSGKAIAALITLSLVPIIARLFDPVHFGAAALFVSFFVIMGPLSTLCYERAVVLPDNEGHAIKLVWLAFSFLVVFNVLFMLVLLLSEITGFELPFIDKIGIWKWFLPLAILLNGLVNIAENWLVRKKRYKLIASSDVTQSLGITLSRIFLGLISGSSLGGLIYGYLIGVVLKLGVLGRGFLQVFQRNNRCSLKDLTGIAKEFKDFPVYNAPARFVRAFSKNLPVLMLGYMFSPAVAGFYAMANRLVRMPMDIATSSVRRAYLQRTAEMSNQGEKLFGMQIKFTVVMALLGVLPLMLLWYEGQQIIAWLLGDKWSEAGYYAQLLSPWLYSIWVTTPSSALVLVLRKQKLWLNIQILITVLLTSVFFYAYLKGEDSINTLKMFVYVATFSNAGIIIIMLRLVYQQEKRAIL